MARDYDLGIIVNPDAGDEQARAIVERVTQFVGANGGQVVRVNAVGRRHLAYPIEHHRDGLYFWFDLILPPEGVTELDRTLRINEDVIRHLLRLRDPRTVAQARQREAEQDAQAAAHAAAQAARAEAQAAAAAEAKQAAPAEIVAEVAPIEAEAEALPDVSDDASEDEGQVVPSGAEARE
jgi:small subunit ribosomal protein S6